MCAGWIGRRRSSVFRDVPTKPNVRFSMVLQSCAERTWWDARAADRRWRLQAEGATDRPLVRPPQRAVLRTLLASVLALARALEVEPNVAAALVRAPPGGYLVHDIQSVPALSIQAG